MTEHLSPVVIEEYHRQKLAPADLIRVDDHLAQCPECRRLVELTLNNDAIGLYAELAAEATVDRHLTFEQIATYVDGLPSGEERRLIEDHLASCGECAPLVVDLNAFRNEITPDLGREFRPAFAPSEGLRDRIGAVFTRPIFKLPLWAYTAALLLLSVFAWLAWQAIIMQTAPKVAITPPTSGPSPSINPASPTPAASTVLAQLNDGGSTLTLDSQGRMTGVDQWPPEYQQMAKDALANRRVERSPLLAGLSRPGSSLMGGDDEGRRFAIIEPAGKVVLSDRPVFRWSKLNGATGYVVEVYDEQFNPVTSSALLTDNSWTAPPLARGRVYGWQVKVIKDKQEFIAPRPPAPQAKFRIIDQAMAAEIARARRDYGSSHLLLGLIYARSGLLAEAEQEFRKLQNVNSDSEVARKLTASVSELRR